MNQNPSKQLQPYYQPMLRESINRFIAEHRKGTTDFSDFSSIFSRTLHRTPDPPIPLVWFYSALEFHNNRLGMGREASRTSIASVKGLFQLLVSCSDGCVSMKRIGVLAPLVFELYRLMVYEKEMKSDTEGLVDGVVSYCSILCMKERVLGDDGKIVFLEEDFVDLIPVWMVVCDCYYGRGLFEVGDFLKGFFPFVSDGVRKGIEMGCCEVGFLAGVVMFEAFLLKMCLIFDVGITKEEKEKKLHDSAAQITTGFQNFYFLGKNLLLLILITSKVLNCSCSPQC